MLMYDAGKSYMTKVETMLYYENEHAQLDRHALLRPGSRNSMKYPGQRA